MNIKGGYLWLDLGECDFTGDTSKTIPDLYNDLIRTFPKPIYLHAKDSKDVYAIATPMPGDDSETYAVADVFIEGVYYPMAITVTNEDVVTTIVITGE